MAELMTVEELEKYLRFTRITIYRLLKEGSIPATKIGNKWRFDKEIIDKWLHRNMEGVKARILVIDDEEIILTLFKETLEERGHTVVTADTSAKGLAYVMQQDFDLIFRLDRLCWLRRGLSHHAVPGFQRIGNRLYALLLLRAQISGTATYTNKFQHPL